MPIDESAAIDELCQRASSGDVLARQELLARYRDRLSRMVSVRIDRRLAQRLDPSDVVQDVLLEATRHLSDYLRLRPMPFYPWLRRLAWERLIQLHRSNVRAHRRSVLREGLSVLPLPDDSSYALADQLLAKGVSPSSNLIRGELRERVWNALQKLSGRDREVLVLRYLEQLSTSDTATILEISEGGVKSRLMRAIIRLREVLDDDRPG
jgi:RNA polymerase sigma-70 factor, ECF subfamily